MRLGEGINRIDQLVGGVLYEVIFPGPVVVGRGDFIAGRGILNKVIFPGLVLRGGNLCEVILPHLIVVIYFAGIVQENL